jgi:hypothetical protein
MSCPLPERPLLTAPRSWTTPLLGRRFAVTLIAFVVGVSFLAIVFMDWGFVF